MLINFFFLLSIMTFVTFINMLLNSSGLVFHLVKFQEGNKLNLAHRSLHYLTHLSIDQMIKVSVCISRRTTSLSIFRLSKCQSIAFLYIFNIFLFYMSRLSFSWNGQSYRHRKEIVQYTLIYIKFNRSHSRSINFQKKPVEDRKHYYLIW
jgi:hypothetical protein